MINSLAINKQKIPRNKAAIMSIALILLLAISSLVVLSSTVSAHNPPITIPTYVYLNAYPPVIGVGQTVNLLAWSAIIPPTANGEYGDRWTGLTITVTAPDNTTSTQGHSHRILLVPSLKHLFLRWQERIHSNIISQHTN